MNSEEFHEASTIKTFFYSKDFYVYTTSKSRTISTIQWGISVYSKMYRSEDVIWWVLTCTHLGNQHSPADIEQCYHRNSLLSFSSHCSLPQENAILISIIKNYFPAYKLQAYGIIQYTLFCLWRTYCCGSSPLCISAVWSFLLL